MQNNLRYSLMSDIFDSNENCPPPPPKKKAIVLLAKICFYTCSSHISDSHSQELVYNLPRLPFWFLQTWSQEGVRSAFLLHKLISRIPAEIHIKIDNVKSWYMMAHLPIGCIQCTVMNLSSSSLSLKFVISLIMILLKPGTVDTQLVLIVTFWQSFQYQQLR